MKTDRRTCWDSVLPPTAKMPRKSKSSKPSSVSQSATAVSPKPHEVSLRFIVEKYCDNRRYANEWKLNATNEMKRVGDSLRIKELVIVYPDGDECEMTPKAPLYADGVDGVIREVLSLVDYITDKCDNAMISDACDAYVAAFTRPKTSVDVVRRTDRGWQCLSGTWCSHQGKALCGVAETLYRLHGGEWKEGERPTMGSHSMKFTLSPIDHDFYHLVVQVSDEDESDDESEDSEDPSV